MPMTNAEKQAAHRKRHDDYVRGLERELRNHKDSIQRAYFRLFPGDLVVVITKEVERAMCRAVATGIDQPIMIKQRKIVARNIAKHEAELAAEHAQPFTSKLEKHYTRRIKNRLLIEGDCERPWQSYFAYREAHFHDVEPLTDDDLKYAGLWTSCAIPSARSIRSAHRRAGADGAGAVGTDLRDVVDVSVDLHGVVDLQPS
jgi:hypothetical protein